MVVIIEYMYAVTWFLVGASEGSIRWNLSTKYAVFGSNAKLTCHAQACPRYSFKKWFGGKSYNLLCLDGTSANPEKYAMTFNDSSDNFELMIKNFSLTDTNCKYTCACGFLQYTNMLNIKDFNIIYPPKVYQYSNKTTERSFEIDIAMYVYPRPTCAVTYEDIIIPMNVNVANTYLEREFMLKRVSIQHVLDAESNSCRGTFNITCQVGLLNYTLGDGQLDLCKDVVSNVVTASCIIDTKNTTKVDRKTKESIEIISSSVMASVIGVGVVVVVLYMSKKYKNKWSKYRPPGEHLEHEDITSADIHRKGIL